MKAGFPYNTGFLAALAIYKHKMHARSAKCLAKCFRIDTVILVVALGSRNVAELA
jgi:hypothetical protein